MENKPGNNISLKEVTQLEMLNQSFMEYDEIEEMLPIARE